MEGWTGRRLDRQKAGRRKMLEFLLKKGQKPVPNERNIVMTNNGLRNYKGNISKIKKARAIRNSGT